MSNTNASNIIKAAQSAVKPSKPSVIAQVNTNAVLCHVPSIQGKTLAQLPATTKITVLARDEKLEWLNIKYISTTGRAVTGWIPFSKVSNITYDGNPIRTNDLAITDFRYNTRSDMADLIKAKRAELGPGSRILFFALFLALIVGFGGMTLYDSSTEKVEGYGRSARVVQETDDMGQTAGTGLMGVAVVVFFAGAILAGKKNRPIQQEIKRLNTIRRKKNRGMTFIEDATKAAGVAAGAATILGGIAMASKSGSKNKRS